MATHSCSQELLTPGSRSGITPGGTQDHMNHYCQLHARQKLFFFSLPPWRQKLFCLFVSLFGRPHLEMLRGYSVCSTQELLLEVLVVSIWGAIDRSQVSCIKSMYLTHCAITKPWASFSSVSRCEDL